MDRGVREQLQQERLGPRVLRRNGRQLEQLGEPSVLCGGTFGEDRQGAQQLLQSGIAYWSRWGFSGRLSQWGRRSPLGEMSWIDRVLATQSR